ncbi:helicase-exonuclease AddAB subunit AddB [Paenibacillus mucilaginosus]|uniref:ATP-dependent helicase/deoxyribonuclease subunit B n=1 Tax=Paenibacillus mucilaginosus (strain KNP414) TaxID=1036673 RepID=F8FFN9_PAEMK|nr:helicase-exonuclease AddAB subunit AddB [Paenibacillus mucilaginosus]AEI42666.1 ATP-dependent nuclease, subunit B [Paenibacillus mucilaginosus KNP414]MCG7217084.1 helicase-exonuclease AddAB subunit AddB [Paenibacillus mucilaginosus]WDM26056.1 helicase-exonuclease AddAB subunit AddB [Paenibacillus mucilaginosus]
MAYRFVLGRAGSGKTTYCLKEIQERLGERPEGRPIIWLVPEQATFQTEYALVNGSGLGGTMRAQVLSFRRLAWRVMQEVGGTARLPIDEIGKKLLLHRILHRGKDRLRRFHASADQMGFIDNLNDILSELKRYCVAPEDLAAFYTRKFGDGGPGGGSLEDKLHDLQVVYAEFETELSKLYLDGEDYLTLLARQLPESAYAQGAEVWVDGFHGFTPQELAVLVKLGERADRVTITLCLDRPYLPGEPLNELELFHLPARTMQKLQELLREAQVDVLEPVVLPAAPPARFAAQPMLAYLEAHWDDRVKQPCPVVPLERSLSPLHITQAAGRRAEVEGAARDIIALVRDRGLRWRDISVSLRDMESYCDLIKATFEDYGIPHFFDVKRSILHHPLVELIRSSLEACGNHWKYDAVFRSIKTGFFIPMPGENVDPETGIRIDRHAMDQLENYVLAFGIQGSRWTDDKDWTYSYRTTLEDDGEARAADEAFLKRINACRRQVSAPMGELYRRMKGRRETVRERVEHLYGFLTGLRVPERLEYWSQKALGEGEPETARMHGQVWDRVMDVLDQLVELMGQETVTLELFTDLLETGLESIRLGLVPPTLDQVLVGSMDRTRSGRIKHTFVLGATEGVMPAKMPEKGLLTESEREFLAQSGLETADTGRRRLLDESFLMYYAFCTPSEGLWLSYPLADEEGRSLLPSDIIRQIKRMFPSVKERLLQHDPEAEGHPGEHMEYVSRPGPAFSLLSVQLRQWLRGAPMNVVWWSVYNWFTRLPEHDKAQELSRMVKALRYTGGAMRLSPETSRLLYGDLIQTSVSRMERFVACPFSQFASHGLRLKERRIFRLEAPDVGQLFHAALSSFVEQAEREQMDWHALTPEESAKRAAFVIDTLAPRLQGEILLSSERYLYIARKLKQVVGRAALMLGEHAKRGQFRPIGLEVGFGAGQQIPPLHYALPNGVQMELRGRIDRIDRADTDKGTLLRVIDYKSSAKSLNMAEVYYGLSLQMLTYLDVILTHAPVWLGKEAEPAGVLYFHVHNPLLNAKNGMTAEQIDKELKKRFKMRGLLKADPDVITLMDSRLAGSSGHSELLPAALKADGSFYKTSSVASEEQWNTVREHVRNTIQEIGTSMTDGEIGVHPYRMGQNIACSTCSFRPVCQFDPQLEDNEYRILPQMGKELAWDLMAKKNSKAEEKRKRSAFRSSSRSSRGRGKPQEKDEGHLPEEGQLLFRLEENGEENDPMLTDMNEGRTAEEGGPKE